MTLGTAIAGLLLAAALVLAVRKIIKDRKDGKSSCGFGCNGCAMRDTCHRKEKEL